MQILNVVLPVVCPAPDIEASPMVITNPPKPIKNKSFRSPIPSLTQPVAY